MRQKYRKTGIIIFILSLLGGCAVGQTVDYHSGSVDYQTDFGKDRQLLVSFQDVRPYVLSGDKSASFVGLQRSLYGIPYPVTTKSGSPLANDIGKVVVNSLSAKGIRARSIVFPLKGNVSNFIKDNAKEKEKILLFTMYEWKTDVHYYRRIDEGAYYQVSNN